jgi:chorismate synthase
MFLEINKTKDDSQLVDNVGLLKNLIHTYEIILFHSLNMITSILEKDRITFREIYEEFDKLKIFRSDYEREMTETLSEIKLGINMLLNKVNSMERNIINGLNNLTYVTQDGFSNLNNSLSRELQSINSSIDTNNLLTGIQTYQLYKINKQTKGLLNN